jgi:hypothetical protein
MPLTNQQAKEHREQYMQGKITHDEHYIWLADQIGVTLGDLPVSLEVIRKSTDPHLNDIPLKQWDFKHSDLLAKIPLGVAWSLSDTVCVLKAFARREAAK